MYLVVVLGPVPTGSSPQQNLKRYPYNGTDDSPEEHEQHEGLPNEHYVATFVIYLNNLRGSA